MTQKRIAAAEAEHEKYLQKLAKRISKQQANVEHQHTKKSHPNFTENDDILDITGCDHNIRDYGA